MVNFDTFRTCRNSPEYTHNYYLSSLKVTEVVYFGWKVEIQVIFLVSQLSYKISYKNA